MTEIRKDRVSKSRQQSIMLWTAQVLLALVFGASGLVKSFAPMEEIAKNLPWVTEYSPWLPRFIGISELLGAIGVVFPWALKIMPSLTRIAALGLALIMILAAAFHLWRGEYPAILVNAVLFAVAGFVAKHRG